MKNDFLGLLLELKEAAKTSFLSRLELNKVEKVIIEAKTRKRNNILVIHIIK